MAIAAKEQSLNGHAELTPEQRLVEFQQALEALLLKYQVQLVPFIITLNDGRQLADAKFMLVQK